VPLDKSEGPVKRKLSLAMRKHRYLRSLWTDDGRHQKASLTWITLRWKVLQLLLPFHQPSIRP